MKFKYSSAATPQKKGHFPFNSLLYLQTLKDLCFYVIQTSKKQYKKPTKQMLVGYFNELFKRSREHGGIPNFVIVAS